MAPGKTQHPIALALQGGGAHGAFTWGVLDRLLEDGRLRIEAVSGASAGAINACVMAQGWIDGGSDGARALLERFWRAVSAESGLPLGTRAILDRLLNPWRVGPSAGALWTDWLSRWSSPYAFNPLDINPLRDIVERLIDFDRLRREAPFRLFVAATKVRTGRVAIFSDRDLTCAHLLASACLPKVFRAVEIDGEAYWDGGYMGNPPLFPLFYDVTTDDILLVQINPIERAGTPRLASEIEQRLNEITFNASLLGELRAIAFVQRLLRENRLARDRYKDVKLHRIAADAALRATGAGNGSKLDTSWSFLTALRDEGRRAATRFLDDHAEQDLGRRGTLDLAALLYERQPARA